MKKLFLGLIILFSITTTYAQQKNDVKAKAETSKKTLEGVWVVEHIDKLPTYLKEEYRVFLKDSLFFGSSISHTFGNTSEDKYANTYQYDVESKKLMVFNSKLEGIEYTIKSVEEDKLIFSVPNSQLNDYRDLVYIRVKTPHID
jgi:hypothetical protein